MRSLVLILLCVACSSTEGVGFDATKKQVPAPSEARRFEVDPVDLTQAHFYAHEPEQRTVQEPLKLDEFKVSIVTAPGTLRTQIDVVIRNPSDKQKQARIRLPIPEDAAVVKAVLYVGDKPMKGAFLSSARAEAVYSSIVAQKRDPLLAVWSGPKWVDIQIFPIEGKQTRRFQLEWVEPRITTGQEEHRVPLFAHEGKVVSQVSTVLLNGKEVIAQKGILHLPINEPTLVAAKRPEDAFGYVLVSGKATSKSGVVLIAETSAQMSKDDRVEQRRALESVLDRLPASTQVTLFSADWLTKMIVERVSPQEAKHSLASLDSIVSAGSFDFENTFSEAAAAARSVGTKTLVFFGRGGRARHTHSAIALLQKEALSVFIVSPEKALPALLEVAWSSGGDVLTDKTQLTKYLSGFGDTPELPGVEGWTAMYSAEREPVWLARFTGEVPKGASLGVASDLKALWRRSHLGSNPDKSATQQVLTPTTSILVLESNEAYKRWGIPVPTEENYTVDSQTTTKEEKGTEKESTANEKRDMAEVYGGLLGNEVGEMSGGWGYGISGSTTGWGTIGSGNYGTIGYGGGRRAGGQRAGESGGGRRGPMGRVRVPKVRMGRVRVPKVRMQEAWISGGLDKGIIRRYIRRKLSRIRFCYEKELVHNPRLSGALVIYFQISPEGSTNGVHAKGMKNSKVDSCVVAAIESIRFPKPNGHVNVRYPFTFKQESEYRVVTPDSPLKKALAIFKTSDPSKRVAKLSKQLEVDFKSVQMLAWWIVRVKVSISMTPVEGIRLAALLLHDAGETWNARRVLSEVAHLKGSSFEVEEQMRWMGDEAGAKRLASMRL